MVVNTKKRVHLFISGRVQGVFFREYMKDIAIKAGAKGWVRNLPDGRVEAIVEGDSDAVDEVVRWCHRGSPASRVNNVEIIKETYNGEFADFKVIRY